MKKSIIFLFLSSIGLSGCSLSESIPKFEVPKAEVPKAEVPKAEVPKDETQEMQFIDVDDTLKIKAGMNKVETLEALGRPVEVLRGIVMEDGKTYEMWKYLTKQGFGKVTPKDLPRKPPKNMKFENWSPLFKELIIMFEENKIVRWGDFEYQWQVKLQEFRDYNIEK